jgi:hypothetical protein
MVERGEGTRMPHCGSRGTLAPPSRGSKVRHYAPPPPTEAGVARRGTAVRPGNRDLSRVPTRLGTRLYKYVASTRLGDPLMHRNMRVTYARVAVSRAVASSRWDGDKGTVESKSGRTRNPCSARPSKSNCLASREETTSSVMGPAYEMVSSGEGEPGDGASAGIKAQRQLRQSEYAGRPGRRTYTEETFATFAAKGECSGSLKWRSWVEAGGRVERIAAAMRAFFSGGAESRFWRTVAA